MRSCLVANIKVMHILFMCVCEVGISFGAVQSILPDILGMSKVSARWVP